MRTNVRIKFTGGKLRQILISDKNIFSDKSVDMSQELPDPEHKSEREPKVDSDDMVCEPKTAGLSVARSRARAIRTMRDLIDSNPDLDIFYTYTLDPAKIDRYSYTDVVEKWRQWADNRVRRHGMKYVGVAEHHKDGAIHFHGVTNSNAHEWVDSGHKDSDGHTIYNLESWKLGFSTAIFCYGSRSRLSSYIVKYIRKGDKVGGRWYYHGGKLEKPTYIYDSILTNSDSDSLRIWLAELVKTYADGNSKFDPSGVYTCDIDEINARIAGVNFEI